MMIGLHYGGLADTLAKQIRAQKFKYHPASIANFEKQRGAILRLRMAGLLTDSMADTVYKKLHKNIIKHLEKFNP